MGEDDLDAGKALPEVHSADNGRSGLLAAIRAAGGAKGAGLKSADAPPATSTNHVDGKSGQGKSGGGGGLDLMGEIAQKLAMRRKGMSGKANTDLSTCGKSNPIVPKPSGAMDKISSMIPPPSGPKIETQNDDESDDEW